jgi:uncharacterized membrane protein YcaP (DUF421 family)
MGTILGATLLYWFMLFILRAVPRRTGDIVTPFEFILIFLIGGSSIQVVEIEDHSLANALLGITTVGMNHFIVATLKQKFASFGRIVDGTPIVLYQAGKWYKDRMDMVRSQPQDVLTAVRDQGLTSIDKVKLAVLERNGGYSIIKKDEQG